MVNLSVEQFFNIIADPTTYQNYLTTIREEQARLDALIETVGKASEIEKMRKEAKEFLDKAQAAVAEAETKSDALINRTKSSIEGRQAELSAKIDEQGALVKEQKEVLAETRKKNSEAKSKLVEAEKTLADANAAKSKYEALAAEYEEKVAKLRSVMS